MYGLPMYPVQAKTRQSILSLQNIKEHCHLMPNPILMDFISVFSFFCEDFNDCPTIDFCCVHDFVEVDLFLRVPYSEKRFAHTCSFKNIGLKE